MEKRQHVQTFVYLSQQQLSEEGYGMESTNCYGSFQRSVVSILRKAEEYFLQLFLTGFSIGTGDFNNTKPREKNGNFGRKKKLVNIIDESNPIKGDKSTKFNARSHFPFNFWRKEGKRREDGAFTESEDRAIKENEDRAIKGSEDQTSNIGEGVAKRYCGSRDFQFSFVKLFRNII